MPHVYVTCRAIHTILYYTILYYTAKIRGSLLSVKAPFVAIELPWFERSSHIMDRIVSDGSSVVDLVAASNGPSASLPRLRSKTIDQRPIYSSLSRLVPAERENRKW